ncbi:MFS general substrate transporter [Dipodascopsis tothii]|uniref:MFS general substrate transporter n=1 Tax=Dipodascopsis tothii TaxID=44089 RepID=UPI0034D00C35
MTRQLCETDRLDEKMSDTSDSDRASVYSTFTLTAHDDLLASKQPPAVDVGLRPWLIVVGGFSAQVCSFGYINVVGIFQEYYQTHQLQLMTPSTIAWIGSVQSFVLSFASLLFGRMSDVFGPRLVVVPGAIMLVVGVFATGFCTEFYQFMLAQGVCTGLGSSALFYSSTAAVSSWFSKRRATAFGVAASGASFGGIIFPITIRHIEEAHGFRAAIFAVSAILLFFSLVACFTLTGRLAPVGWKDDGRSLVQLYAAPLREPAFVVLTVGYFFAYLGLFVPFAYLTGYAVHEGASTSMAFYMVAFLNAGSIFGRIICGRLADHFGNFNVQTIFILVSSLASLALWLPTHSPAATVAYSVIYGFCSGGVLCLYPAVVAKISPISEIGTRMGTITAFMAVGSLAGSPIAGQLISAMNGSFAGVCIFTGVSLALAAAGVFTCKIMISHDAFSKT